MDGAKAEQVQDEEDVHTPLPQALARFCDLREPTLLPKHRTLKTPTFYPILAPPSGNPDLPAKIWDGG